MFAQVRFHVKNLFQLGIFYFILLFFSIEDCPRLLVWPEFRWRKKKNSSVCIIHLAEQKEFSICLDQCIETDQFRPVTKQRKNYRHKFNRPRRYSIWQIRYNYLVG